MSDYVIEGGRTTHRRTRMRTWTSGRATAIQAYCDKPQDFLGRARPFSLCGTRSVEFQAKMKLFPYFIVRAQSLPCHSCVNSERGSLVSPTLVRTPEERWRRRASDLQLPAAFGCPSRHSALPIPLPPALFFSLLRVAHIGVGGKAVGRARTEARSSASERSSDRTDS